MYFKSFIPYLFNGYYGSGFVLETTEKRTLVRDLQEKVPIHVSRVWYDPGRKEKKKLSYYTSSIVKTFLLCIKILF